LQTLVIELEEVNLVAEKYEGNEIIVYLQDKQTNSVTQDIVTVRHAVVNGVQTQDTVECLVWSDAENEDYTHRFVIKRIPEEEEHDAGAL
jgi:hypothetical protein